MNIFIFSSILVLLLNACDVLALKRPFAHDFTLSICSPWNQKDPDQPWDRFRNIINHVSDIYAPVKTRKVRSTYSPWLTAKIRCEMNKRELFKKRAVKSNSKNLYRAYKDIRNEVNILIKC